MRLISEFKIFILKGNVIDLAIGVIIGSAFGKIVSSLVDDVITPLLLKPALKTANLNRLDELTIFGSVKYGIFISAVINFIIIALILFIIIKTVNVFKRKQRIAPTLTSSKSEQLLTEIRDLLKNK